MVVLANARPHTAAKVKQRIDVWQSRGLYLFYLPTYSPDLNLAQTLCRKRKYEWLRPQEYLTKDELFYAVDRAFAVIGDWLQINLSSPDFNLN